MSNCFGRGKKMNEKCNKCWSLNEEDFFDDWCDLVDELEQEGLVGKYATVKYFDQGGYDLPRFPVFKSLRDPMDFKE